MKRLLPNKDSPEWEREKENYLNSTRAWRIQRAKELGYSNADSYMEAWRRELERYGLSCPRDKVISPKEPKPKIQIMPIPKIKLRPPPIQEEIEEEEEQVALFGDSQAGLKTKTFNSKVLSKRILKYYNTVCRFADIHRKFCPVKKLNLFLLGDLPHGEAIGKQVMLDELELDLYQQKWLMVNELSNMIINACQWYETIDIICVAGNHGVLGKYFSFAANWNIEIYDLLKSTITPNYPQVNFIIEPYDFYIIHKIKNVKFLVLHGDKIPMYLSLPFYGIDRRSLRWNQSLPPWDILVMGHFHSLSYIQPSGIPIIMNGTFSSDSRFVAQWLGIREIAEQWTFFVGNKHPLTAVHKIDLQREEG